MTKAAEMRCRLCNRNMFECGGWLERVNAKGGPAILECRPECLAELSQEQKVLGAITGGGGAHDGDGAMALAKEPECGGCGSSFEERQRYAQRNKVAEYVSVCPHCGAEKCVMCDMGNDVECGNCGDGPD